MASAPSFTTDRIRNVCVVGHGGSGKTTLVDACCFTSGSSKRQGSVDDGTALTMFTPEETSHGISMNVSVAHAAWMDTKVNFIDTPGYLDFLGETRAGVRVAGSGIGIPGMVPYTSRMIVTGPSLTSSTSMCAPNLPASTGTPRPRSAWQKRS